MQEAREHIGLKIVNGTEDLLSDMPRPAGGDRNLAEWAKSSYSMADAEACFNSPEYVEAAAHRRVAGVATNELVIVEGGDATPR